MGDGGWGVEGEGQFVKLNLGDTNLLVPALLAVSHLLLESVVLPLESYIDLESMLSKLEFFYW